jgi:hypothetical protein
MISYKLYIQIYADTFMRLELTAEGRVIGRAEVSPKMRLADLTPHSREAVPGGKSAGLGPVGPDIPP